VIRGLTSLRVEKDGLMGLVGDVGETGFDEVIAVPVV